MPTIPLYSRAAAPDGCHQVTSPGGYEWWHFEARSVSDDRWISARLSSGLPFDRRYVRRYLRYRRHPTRVLPPRPDQFLEARLEVFHGDELKTRVVTRHDASDWRGGVLVMPRLNLRFRPRGGGTLGAIAERQFMPQSFVGGAHRWIIGGALCDVEGQLDSRDFRGFGYQDHQYGTDLPARDAKCWFHGQALGDDGNWCVAFHRVQPCDWRAHAEVRLIESDESGAASERDVQCMEMDGSRATRFLLTYPTTVRVGDVMNLSRGRAIASSFVDVQVMYDAEHRGKEGKAVCTMIYPQRLRWPGR